MSIFLSWRVIFFVLVIVLNAAICSTAGFNVTTTAGSGALRSLDMYLIVLSATTVLFTVPVFIIDFLRRGAVTSQIWFECVWCAALWVLNLAGAAAASALSASPVCPAGNSSCLSSQVLIAITWISCLLLLAQFLLVFISSIYYQYRHPDMWKCSVKEFQWFNGGGSGKSAALGSGPSSPTFVPKELKLAANNPVPHLEQLAARWQPTPVPRGDVERQMGYSIDQPQPLTFAYAPELPMARDPIHYTATAVLTVGVLPHGRRPSTKKRMPSIPSLYPTSVQPHLHSSADVPPTFDQSPPAILSSQSNITLQSLEPPPIKNWPRVNPQEPFCTKKSATPSTPEPLAAAPAPLVRISSESTQASAVPTPRPSGPRTARRRPPPLDLSQATPKHVR